jgi:hypothetical protein
MHALPDFLALHASIIGKVPVLAATKPFAYFLFPCKIQYSPFGFSQFFPSGEKLIAP